MSTEDFTEETSEPCAEGAGVTIDDFVAYLPTHSYIFTPCREVWVRTGVDSCLPPVPMLDANGRPKRKNGKPVLMRASQWLDQNRRVEQMTWAPGYPMLIKDRLVVKGGWIEREGVTTFNHYRPPRIQPGDASKAGPWLEHAHKIYPDDDTRIITWLAHRVQRPQEKINHALVLGGAQGIGKDSLLEPVKHAVGPWNFREVSPVELTGRFNEFVRSVIVRVSEAHDLGESERGISRFQFYERTKRYTVTPPDVIPVDEKYLPVCTVFNVFGLLITTNYRTDALHLPADDRRHDFAWSNNEKEEFPDTYWNELWGWYHAGGFEHVTAYLSELDISGFNPKAPPPQTSAFWGSVLASAAPEDAELADVIDKLGNPDALTVKQLIAAATGPIAEWLMERKNRRALPYRLERCGYVAVKNPDRPRDGLWKINDERQIIYAKTGLSPAEAIKAARKLV